MKIHRTSKGVKPRLEYERRIITKQIEVTSAEPPLPKIEKSGTETSADCEFAPRLSRTWRRLIAQLKFESPEKKAPAIGAIHAYITWYG